MRTNSGQSSVPTPGLSRIRPKTVSNRSVVSVDGETGAYRTRVSPQLVQSDDPDARVVVKRSDEKVDEIRLEQGQGVARIRAGDYEIELAGKTDGLTLIPNDKKISVSRGGQVQVEIRRSVASDSRPSGQILDPNEPKYNGNELEKDAQYFQLVVALRELDQAIRVESKRYGPKHPRITQLTDEREITRQRLQQRRSELLPRRDRLQRLAEEESTVLAADQHPEIQPGAATENEPRYDGKTLEQWFTEMEYERKPERLEEALRAVSALITHPANQDKVDLGIQSIFHLSRQYGLLLGGNRDIAYSTV